MLASCANETLEQREITSPKVRALHQSAIDCGFSADFIIETGQDTFAFNPNPKTEGDWNCLDYGDANSDNTVSGTISNQRWIDAQDSNSNMKSEIN